VSRIQHVALETRRDDVEAEVRFWALLGFSRVEPPGGLAERSTWVQSGSPATQIHLLHADDPATAPEGHVAVVCEDYEAVQATLRAAGFEVDERTQHWGAPRCLTRSPGGHRVEVMAAPPA
jgi:catechol 2,3-dioxygenase-like lactoylglutathione lyase family enzyme